MESSKQYNSVLTPGSLLYHVFRDSPVGMALLTADDGVYVDANDAFANLLGLRRDELVGHPFTIEGFLVGLDRSAALELLRQGKFISDVPFRFIRSDGRVITCIASVQYESIEGVNYFLAIVQDITEHEIAHQALQQSETRFRLFFNSIPLPLLVIDEKTFRILDVNPAACRLYGYTRDEFLALSIIHLIPPGGMAHNPRHRSQILGGTTNSIVTTQMLKDGSLIQANVTSFSFSLEGRRANLSIVQDVTEQNRLQAALEDGELRLRIIADLTADAIWDRDLVSGGITWNVGLSTLFGYMPQESGTYRWWHEHVHPDDRKHIDEIVREAMESGKNNWSGEYRFRRADDSYAHVLDNGYIVRDEAGRPIRQMGSMVDITEQLRVTEYAAQATLEERQRLALTLKDSVTQSLYSISLLAEAARRQVESNRQTIQIDHINRLRELSMQTIRQLRLMVYELRPGVLEQEGLTGALRHRLEAVEHRAGIKGRLIDDSRVTISTAMQADLFWITQEALNNSLHHASASVVAVRLSNDDECLKLEITDNGRGFDLDTEDTTGGLAAIRRRVDDLRGNMEVIAPPGGGVNLVIRVPF